MIYHPFDQHVTTGEISLERFCDWIATLEDGRNRCCEVPLKSNAGLKWGPSLVPVARGGATPTPPHSALVESCYSP